MAHVEALSLSDGVPPCSLRYPQSNCACTLSPTELTMETKTLFGSGREEIYVCVRVIIRDVLSFHNEIETACV